MARAVLVSLGSLLALGVLGTVALAHPGHHRRAKKHVYHPSGDDMAGVPEVPVAMAQRAPTRGVTVYLNGDGGTVTGGWDDSATNVSSIAWDRSDEVTVPRWKGTKKAWSSVVQCVRDRFDDFAIDIVTDRPASGEYVMIMVGGQPSMFGYSDAVGGIAPYTGEVIRNAIGYVFAANGNYDVENTCVAILHETGHTLGLDHEYLCEDPMSYLWGCGEKHWQEQSAPCGEEEARSCGNGEEEQSSYRLLAANVGLRGEDPPVADDPPVATEDPPIDDEPAADPDDAGDAGCDDGAGPSVAIDDPGDELAGNGWIEIDVRADSDAGIDDVELGWASETAQFVFACGSIGDDQPAQCSRDGNVFRFQLWVGTGLRAMAARATDGDGNQTVTEARVLTLTD
jgi:hypothetical protein